MTKVITCIDQVTVEWLTAVLAQSGALTQGRIASFTVDSGQGNWSTNATNGLKPHWPNAMQALFANHPQAIIMRTQDDNGFTIIHGDPNQSNIMVPREEVAPIYLIDRQPFNWSLTTWLGAYDLAYAMVLDWEVETRRLYEIPVLKRYHTHLIKNGIVNYSWQRLYDDYRLCVAMCVYIATEYCRDGVSAGSTSGCGCSREHVLLVMI